MTRILASAIIASVWRRNVEYVDRRLNMFRHQAIAQPSLDIFHPLTLLRRNIADLQDALAHAKSSTEVFASISMEELRRIAGSRVPSLLAPYEVLLDQVKAMSISLSNEIQLVIGSVTVQVCPLPLLDYRTSG